MTISDRIVNQGINARFLIDTGRVDAIIGYDALDSNAQKLFNACFTAPDSLTKTRLLTALGDSIAPNLERPVGTSYEIYYDGGSLTIDLE